MSALRQVVLVAAVPIAAAVLFASPANLAPPSTDAALEALQTRLVDLERDNAILRAHMDAIVGDARRTEVTLADVAGRLAEQEIAMTERPAVVASRAETATPRSIERRIETLEDLLVNVRRDGDDLVVEGANLRIVNGMGATDTVNGVGNLILGYNEARPSGNRRSGSHVLVLGTRNNFSGAGGVVAGRGNDLVGDWAAILGGTANAAEADDAVVLGGNGNRAEGPSATVLGGAGNRAIGEGAVVAGGGFNVASGRYAVVGGGMQNEASGDVAVVSRGCDVTVTTCGGN